MLGTVTRTGRFALGYAAVIAVGVLMTSAQSSTSHAALQETHATVHVRVYDYVAVHEQVVFAEQVTSWIFLEAGLHIVWHHCGPLPSTGDDPACSGEMGGALVRIVSRIKPSPGVRKDALGCSVGRLATVSFDRVMDLANESHTAATAILGWALAHEIGHTLLANGHSAEGIMRAMWDIAEIKAKPVKYIFFTREQAEVLRSQALVRDRAQRSASLAGSASEPAIVTAKRSPPQGDYSSEYRSMTMLAEQEQPK